MTIRGLVKLKTRAQRVGAVNKYAACFMGAVLLFDASTKIQEYLSSASTL